MTTPITPTHADTDASSSATATAAAASSPQTIPWYAWLAGAAITAALLRKEKTA